MCEQIRNIKLYDAAQKIEARNQTLCSLLSQMPSRLDDPTFVPSILRQTQEHISADRCSLFLLDPIDNRLWAKNTDTGEDIYVAKDKGIMGQAVKQRRLINVPDVRLDNNFNQHIDIRTGYCTQSMVAVPIISADGPAGQEGTVLGVTSFINRAGGTSFSADETQLIEAISKMCAVGLRWPVLRSERDSLRARFHCLREITSIIGGGAAGGEEISSLIRKVMGKAQEMLGVDRCSMFLLDPDTKELFSRTADGQEIRFSQYLGIAGHCVFTGKPICVKDVKQDSRFLAAVDRKTGYNTYNILCVPIRDTDTAIIGVMQAVNKLDGGDFEPEDEESLVLVSHLCSFLLLRHAYLQQRKKQPTSLASLQSSTAAPTTTSVNLSSLSAGALTAGSQQSGGTTASVTSTVASPQVAAATPPPFHKTMSLASLTTAGTPTVASAIAAIGKSPVARDGGSQTSSGISTPLTGHTQTSLISSSQLATKLAALGEKQRVEELLLAQQAQTASGAGKKLIGLGSNVLNDEKKVGGSSGPTASNWVLFDIQGNKPQTNAPGSAVIPTGGGSGGASTNTNNNSNTQMAQSVASTQPVPSRRAHPNLPQALENMTVFDLHSKKYDLIKSGDAAREEKQQQEKESRKAGAGAASQSNQAMENAHALFAMLGTHKTFGKLTHLFDFEGRKYSGWSPKRYISLRAKVDRDYLRSWEFNALSLSTDEILANVIVMLEELHLVQLMDINKLCRFTGNIARSYRANPYHNFYHALDTMQAVYTFMTTSHVVNGALNTLDRLSGLLGAFCHDVDHPGVTSNFLINVNSPLALFYNDESVLENYHCSVSFLLMRDDEMNIFSKLSPPDLKYVRKVVVATIMATDMAHHFRHITNLKTRIQNLPMKPFASQSFDDRLMLTMLCMKCADLIHLVRPFKVAREWEELIQQEFFLQGDMEKELRLPIGPCNDRFTVDLAASQVYFYNAFGEPLFGSLCSFAPDLQHRLDTLRANCKIWAEEAKRNKLLKAAQAAAQQQKDEAAAKAGGGAASGAGGAAPAPTAAGGATGSNAPAASTATGTAAPTGTAATAPTATGASGGSTIAPPAGATVGASPLPPQPIALASTAGTITLNAGGGLTLSAARDAKPPVSGGGAAGPRSTVSLSRHASMVVSGKPNSSLLAEATKARDAAAAAATANTSSPTANSGSSAGPPQLTVGISGTTKPVAGGAAAAAIALAAAAGITGPPSSPLATIIGSPSSAAGPGSGSGTPSVSTDSPNNSSGSAAAADKGNRRTGAKLHARRTAAVAADSESKL